MKIGQKEKYMTQMKNGNQYKIIFSKLAEKDMKKLKNSGLDKQCKKILNVMLYDPFGYPPPYEKLIGDLSGKYSRRINNQHRIIYEVDNSLKEIHIIRMWTHYE